MHWSEFIYSKLLKPAPLRRLANAVIRAIIPRTVRYGPVNIHLNPKDPVISGALTFRIYERAELKFVRTWARHGMTVLDVGANIGFYTTLFGQAVGPSGRVVALEPDPENLQFLRLNVAANNLTNVTVIPAAASNRPGRFPLYVSENNRGDNRLYENALASGSIDVDVVVLDEALLALGFDNIDFIKLDVQGFEGWVLEGMTNSLARCHQTILLSEFWPEGLSGAGYEPALLLRQLEDHGFTLFELVGSQGALEPISDHLNLIDRYRGGPYCNLVGLKGNPLKG